MINECQIIANSWNASDNESYFANLRQAIWERDR